MYWEEMREEQFVPAIEKLGGLCVLPVSALEKNGPHMPVGANGYIADAIIEEALKLEDTVVFPSGCWLGDVSAYHTENADGTPSWRGSIELSNDLQMTIMEELIDEIARNGFRKILLICKQPTDTLLVGQFMRHFSYIRREFALLKVNAVNEEISRPENVLKTVTERREAFPMITDEDIAVLEKWAETGYGGPDVTFCDTALLMAKHPELVAQDRFGLEDGSSTRLADPYEADGVSFSNMRNLLYPNGRSALPPYGCTESIGQAILKINAEHLAKVFKLLKEDEECVRIAKKIPMKKA